MKNVQTIISSRKCFLVKKYIFLIYMSVFVCARVVCVCLARVRRTYFCVVVFFLICSHLKLGLCRYVNVKFSIGEIVNVIKHLSVCTL